ncbi:TOBE domain-containing protein [Azospirillum sp. RWY-5-1]|uniref:TOBE domain-containing protein n=1 Tax=Azospirillum oleiclasticum TaxID=2735135 RepID=A0ABX2TAP9_9PROT|nr:TOBE domain-containing protein [Azospirillum oleiclasticum]NYZ20258.1 TOBE domain-containing protein [Azospirillum oleiclasticum]
MVVEARLSFGADNASPVGRERIRLLEAVGREGSISAAARATGITYKAAWDAIDAMNNLFGRPLVAAQTGGRRGGGATLTEEGLRLVQTFHRLEAELARALRVLEPELAGTGLSASYLMWGFLMRTSARNALRGTIAAVTDGAVNAEVALTLSATTTLTAIVTRDSVRELGLIPGREATALIKSSFVILAPIDEARRTSVRNRVEGVVTRCERGAVNSEVTLDIGGGKTLTAIITRPSAEALGFRPGMPACALIDAAHIILAID